VNERIGFSGIGSEVVHCDQLPFVTRGLQDAAFQCRISLQICHQRFNVSAF
jgi:hypothetical protein